MYTEQDLAAVQRAIARGERRVEFSTPSGGSRSVTYRSLDELLQLESRISRTLTRQRRPKQTLLVGEKGL